MSYFKITFFSFLFVFSNLIFSQVVIDSKQLTKIAIHEDALMHHIKTLSSDAFEGRKTGTKGALKARKYIIKQFKKSGVLPLSKTYEQAFSFTHEGEDYLAKNILGYVKGTTYPDKYMVISAHYDHLGIKNGIIYNGADDDASGISALFSFADYFKNNPPKHAVILAAFDAEELGMRGSEFFVNNPMMPLKDMVANLNMDMISRSTKNELYAVGTHYNAAFKNVITNNTYSNTIKLLPGHDNDTWKDDWTYASDHAPFHKKGIPFLYFGVEDHEDYHQATDDFENIHPEFYKEAVKVIIRVFNNIDLLQP